MLVFNKNKFTSDSKCSDFSYDTLISLADDFDGQPVDKESMLCIGKSGAKFIVLKEWTTETNE